LLGKNILGSNFSFTIPAFPKSTKASNPEQPDLENDPLKSEAQLPVTEQVLPPRKIVLVIDDEVGMHQLYRRYLNKAGYTVEATSNPDIAEEMVRLIKPQIIILDVRMPNRDGWDVLTKLKALQDTAAIPVVVISIDPDRERALQLGAVEYLNKPFLEEDLLKALVRVETEQAQDRILIVDDRPETVRMIGEWLRTNSPYEIVTATSGEEGLAQIARRLPSLVLLDLYMPDMSGLEMLARLRSDPVTRSLPVILITAEDDLIPIARGQYGDVSILSKNALDEAQLLTGVAAVLGHNAGDNRN
jgi:CheY-like chemotaxis protein